MTKFYLKNERANSSGAMEAETIQKNGAIPKSHTNSEIFLIKHLNLKKISANLAAAPILCTVFTPVVREQKKSRTVKSVFRSAVTGIVLMFVASLLTTGCGSSRTVTAANSAAVSEYELTDDCALLHIYRPASMMGLAIKYNINLNDEPLFRVANKSKKTVRITQPGMYRLWARTETTVEESVDIQLGKEYYIRCTVEMGAFVGRPLIEIVDSEKGKTEFDKIPVKKQ